MSVSAPAVRRGFPQVVGLEVRRPTDSGSGSRRRPGELSGRTATRPRSRQGERVAGRRLGNRRLTRRRGPRRQAPRSAAVRARLRCPRSADVDRRQPVEQARQVCRSVPGGEHHARRPRLAAAERRTRARRSDSRSSQCASSTVTATVGRPDATVGEQPTASPTRPGTGPPPGRRERPNATDRAPRAAERAARSTPLSDRRDEAVQPGERQPGLRLHARTPAGRCRSRRRLGGVPSSADLPTPASPRTTRPRCAARAPPTRCRSMTLAAPRTGRPGAPPASLSVSSSPPHRRSTHDYASRRIPRRRRGVTIDPSAARRIERPRTPQATIQGGTDQ